MYAHYVRLARVEAGIRYYVVVERIPQTPAVPLRCFAEIRSAVRHDLPRTFPKAVRTRILLFATQVLRGGPGHASGPHDAVFLFAQDGGGVGGAGASQLETMGLIGTSGRTIYGMVPDGVATVALPLRPVHGYPKARLIARVVNNVFVAQAPRADLPTGEVWLSATGAVIKRVDLNQ